MIAALLFINQKGEVIIYRTYRDNYNRQVADTFRTQVSHVNIHGLASATQTAVAKRPATPPTHARRATSPDPR